MAATAGRRLIRVEADGQLALPSDLRGRLGLKRGDLISVVETEDGVLLIPEALIATRDIERIDADLQMMGLSLDDLIESGREIRGELLKEHYGIDG